MQNLCNRHNKGIVAALHKSWKLKMSYVSTDFFLSYSSASICRAEMF